MVPIAWSTPPVFSDGNLLTASQLNTMSADLNETAPALATTAGEIFAADGTNSIAARLPGSETILTAQTTANTSYTNLATIGPSLLNQPTGPLALVILTAQTSNNTVNAETCMGLEISNATTVAADDTASLNVTSSVANAQVCASWVYVHELTAGSNSFRAKYRVSPSGTGTWRNRRLSLVPF